MILEIFTKERRNLGRIKVPPCQSPLLDEVIDPDFKDFVVSSLEKGINQRREIYELETGTFFLVEGPVNLQDPIFPIALRDFLSLSGYITREVHPEEDGAILNILAQLPDEDEDKKEILNNLSKMSYLEKTLLLKNLNSANE